MDFKIDFALPVAAELRRVLHEQFATADACLRLVSGAVTDESVHEFRKTMKKLRALLRLIAGAVPSDACKQWRATFRYAASALAQNRDSAVLGATLRCACQAALPDLSPTTCTWSIRPEAMQEGTAPSVQLDASQLRALRGLLRDAAKALIGSPDLDLGVGQLFDGFDRSYRGGRKQLRRLGDSPSPRRLHAFRKRVKEQFYQIQLLVRLAPKAMKRKVAQFDNLGELLGEYHDLFHLRTALEDNRIELSELVRQDALLEWTQARLLSLERDALKLGRQLYRTSPKARLRRLKHLHKARMRRLQTRDIPLRA